MKHFRFEHLPPHLQEVSEPIGSLASFFADTLEGPELTAGLRKLLEAKDCLVRAKLVMIERQQEEGEPCRGCGHTPTEHPNDSGCQRWHQ